MTKLIEDLTNEELNAYLLVNPALFGGIVMKEMGIDGTCMAIEPSKDDLYRITWKHGAISYTALIYRTDIKWALREKVITTNMEVTDDKV